MVRIKKGNKSMDVSNSAYENYYKNSGWYKDETYNVESNETDNDDVESIEDEWAGYEDEEIEKPLSEMTDSEVRSKASSLGINTKGMSIKQIREKIKNYPS